MKSAIRSVQLAAKARGSPTAISLWAVDALAKGGEATYSQPNTSVRAVNILLSPSLRNLTRRHQNPKAARGAVQSSYIIQLLAVHYESVEGAILDVGYPVGALSMAAVAVRSYRACSAPTSSFEDRSAARSRP